MMDDTLRFEEYSRGSLVRVDWERPETLKWWLHADGAWAVPRF